MLGINYDIEPNTFSIMYAGEKCGQIKQEETRVRMTYGRLTGNFNKLDHAIEFIRAWAQKRPPVLKDENVKPCDKKICA